ncbi:MAG: SpoIID/LytB domain-containing protein [Huintestinicola sp.]
MKLRAILNGIAALAIVGMFYSFAFGFEDIEDIDTIGEYHYDSAVLNIETEEAAVTLPKTEPKKEMKPELPADADADSVEQHVGNRYGYAAKPDPEADETGLVITPLYGGEETEAVVTTVPQESYAETENTISAEEMPTEAPVTEAETTAEADTETESQTEPEIEAEYDYLLPDTDFTELSNWSYSEEPEFDDPADDFFFGYGDDDTTETTSVPEVDVIEYNMTYPFIPGTDDYVYSDSTYFETTPTFYTDDTTTPTDVPIDETTGNEIFTAKVGGVESEFDAYTLTCMIVANEMSPYFNPEALKAQAVAAYSYVKYHNVNGLVPTVLVKTNIPDEVTQAVNAVFGKCCYYNGRVAQTVYTASSAGATASAVNVWGGADVPYLRSVSTPFDITDDPNYGVTATFSSDYIRSCLESKLGITLSDDPANWLTVAERVDGNYVSALNVDGQTVISGRKMRESVLGYGIKSSAFDVTYVDGTFTFVTYGYGHGVGMSQNGANILAKQGYTYDQILTFYFPGITVE